MSSNIIVLIDRNHIKKLVKRLSKEISEDYKDKKPVLIGVLKGAFVFLADLIREISIPVEIDFVCCSSYADQSKSSGIIKLSYLPASDIEGRDVILIEDIVDTGLTTRYVLNELENKKPASLRLCSLLDKPSHRIEEVQIDYVGQVIGDKFVVGYGLDMAEGFRYLPDICFIEEKND
jgi:hypoxanthine phosphoribosyltransferase